MGARRRWLGTAVAVALVAGIAVVAPAHAAEQPVCEELLIRADDGVDLYAFVYRPSAVGRFPIAWTMTPYGDRPCGPAPEGAEFARVWVHIRGTGASEGELDGYARRDQQDFAHVVPDWIAAQPWSDGRILAVGASATAFSIPWGLTNPNVSAGLQQMSCVDGYRGCLRPGGGLVGGTLALSALTAGGMLQNYQTRVRMGQDVASPEQVQTTATRVADQWARDTYDEFWQLRSALPILGHLQAPVMYTLDLYDIVPWSMYEGYLYTPGARLNLGLGHNSSSMQSKGDLPELIGGPARRFVRQHVLGEEPGTQDSRVTLVTNLGSLDGYQQGRVMVRGESDWPLPATEWTRLFLAPGPSGSAVSLNDGALALSSPAVESQAPAPIASVAGPRSDLRVAVSAAMAANAGAGQEIVPYESIGDLRTEEASGLTFSTAPLTGDVEVSGPITLRLWATATSPNLDWMVRLTDVSPDGASEWITDGQLRASLRRVDEAQSLKNQQGEIVFPFHTYAAHESVPVGQPVEYLITVTPTSNVFAAGHRIRLDVVPVAAQSFDAARTGGAGAVLIHQGGIHASSVMLPVVPQRCQLGRPGLPDMATPGPCVKLEAALG
jgi:putative CocE/NonD family hydrolase